jgi:AAHS family benzoate transporter-like MFS transporter
MTSPSPPKAAQDEARRKRTVAWVVGLATLGLIFDGYDLVVYGDGGIHLPAPPG